MKLEIFKTPIYIDNIDCKKINLQNINFKKTWLSETESSFKFKRPKKECGRSNYIDTSIESCIPGKRMAGWKI